MNPGGVQCEICRSRPARVMCLRRRQEDTDRTFVCLECAEERARLYSGGNLGLSRLFPQCGDSSFRCGFCGTTLADIVADGRAGCCFCYWRFAQEIEQRVEAVQGQSHHVGKALAR